MSFEGVVTYDAFGRERVVTQTPRDANGTPLSVRTATNTYDAQGRLTATASPEGTVSYTYDQLGRRTATIVGTVANPQRITSYTYDALGRLKTVTEDQDPLSSLDPQLSTLYAYNLLGSLRRTDLPNGVIEAQVYDGDLTKLPIVNFSVGRLS